MRGARMLNGTLEKIAKHSGLEPKVRNAKGNFDKVINYLFFYHLDGF
jgi:hypothetical protein